MSSWTDEDYTEEAYAIISRDGVDLSTSVAESLEYFRDLPATMQPNPKKLLKSVKQLEKQVRGVTL